MEKLKVHLPDYPNLRSSHKETVPRGGGIVLVLISTTASLIGLCTSSLVDTEIKMMVAIPLLGIPIAIVGLLDDRHNLPSSWRYVAQFGTACVLIVISPLPVAREMMLLVIIGITALINFVNFMDGLDGLVASCMAIALTATYIEMDAPWPMWALVGALIGFLLWNWSPAMVFMGDVGSTFLGTVFIGLVLQSNTWREAIGALLILSPLIADSSICLFRRLLAKESVFQSHRLHLYQRLHQSGWSHAKVTTLYFSATCTAAITFLLGRTTILVIIAAMQVLAGIWLDNHIAIPFNRALEEARVTSMNRSD